MTEFFYGVQEVARKANRSASSGRQWSYLLPSPEAVLVSSRSAVGWKLSTWREFAKGRQEPLREDLLKTLSELEDEERELYRKYN